jgi:ABC-type transporter Mla subunit MlaD
MNLSRQKADALIGLLVLTSVGVLLLALAVTRGWTERRVIRYMLSPSVQDLKDDTPVYLQGLQIGEVAGVSPLVDSASMGPPEFVVALRLRELYRNGLRIRLPLGTRAEIASSGLIGSASVSLVVPPNQVAAEIGPSDTIRATIKQSATDALKEVADSLKTQISDVLRDTRRLLGTLDRTADGADREVRATGPELRATMAGVQRALDELQPLLAEARRTLDRTDGRVGTLQDSLVGAMADARRLMVDADSLTRTLTSTTTAITPDILTTVQTMNIVSAKLEYFLDQVSRRPHRLITGIRPLPDDSLRKAAQ